MLYTHPPGCLRLGGIDRHHRSTHRPAAGWEEPLGLFVVQASQGETLEVVLALRPPGRLPCRLNPRQHQSKQDGKNCRDHDELDPGVARPRRPFVDRLRTAGRERDNLPAARLLLRLQVAVDRVQVKIESASIFLADPAHLVDDCVAHRALLNPSPAGAAPCSGLCGLTALCKPGERKRRIVG